MSSYLVVDDDPSTVKALTLLLSGDGHAVTPFTEGLPALEALSRQPFDAVVTDLDMPDVNGHEVVRVARERSPDACVIVASARAEEAREALLEAGACFVANKPVDYDELTSAVAHCKGHVANGDHHRCHMRARGHDRQGAPLRRK